MSIDTYEKVLKKFQISHVYEEQDPLLLEKRIDYLFGFGKIGSPDYELC